MDKNLSKNINDLYDNLSYYDTNGIYILMTIIFIIIVIFVFIYFHILNNIQPIRKEWINERCNPAYIPFAGIINGKSGKEALNFTEDNFSGCVQNILQNITSYIFKPFYYIVDVITEILKDTVGYINMIRDLLNKVRTALSGILTEVFKRINIFMIPIIQMVIVVKDMMSKTIGIITATLFTVFGAYYTLKSLIGSIFELLLKILGIIIAVLVVFIALSFVPIIGFIGTIGATATIPIMMFVLIPIILIKVFMSDILKMQGSGVPSIPSFCFSKETIIPLKNGEKKPVDTLLVGDKLLDDSIVTSTFTLSSKGQEMYNLNGVYVTGRHRVLYCGYYIHVEYHPDAVKVKDFKDPFVYCFNTTFKKIVLDPHVFLDWDEIDDESRKLYITKNEFLKKECGICGDTIIKLKNGTCKPLKDILIGDELVHGERVTGLVKILASHAPNLLEYDLDGNKLILTSNIGFIFQNTYLGKTPRECETPPTYLYHLLTDTFSFTIYDCVHIGEYS
jgi:hypothetical protein